MNISIPCDFEEKATRLLVRTLPYIPETAMSMFSCMQLNNLGISTSFSGRKCVFIDRDEEDRVIGCARFNNDRVFVLIARLVKNSRNKACVTSNPTKNPSCRKLWHRRLGHPNTAVLERMTESHVMGMNPKVGRGLRGM